MKKINSEILRLSREARFITQKELSTMLGVEQGTISKIEKGILPAEEELVEKIAKVLDFPVAFFTRIKR